MKDKIKLTGRIVLRYGDTLDVRDTISEAEETIQMWGEPDAIWEEDEDCEVIREFSYVDNKIVVG